MMTLHYHPTPPFPRVGEKNVWLEIREYAKRHGFYVVHVASTDNSQHWFTVDVPPMLLPFHTAGLHPELATNEPPPPWFVVARNTTPDFRRSNPFGG